MKYLVEKKKFMKLLHSRPALIKTVVDLTEKFCIACLHKEHGERAWGVKYNEFYEVLPPEFKTLAVTREYIKTAGATYGFDLTKVPVEIRKQLSKADRRILLDVDDHINDLPDPTYEEWLRVLTNGYRDYENVPLNMWNREMMLVVAGAGAAHDHHRFSFKFPDHLWDQDLAVEMVKRCASILEVVPTHLINNVVLRACLDRGLEDVQIPESAWDQATAEEAVDHHAHNIQYIPKQYLTEKVNLIAASHSVPFDYLTIKTYPVLVAFVANNSSKDAVDAVNKIKDKEKFILDVLEAREDAVHIFKLGLEISEELWLRIFKKYPSHIDQIDRCDQTPEMVDAFISSASAEMIDKYAVRINLGKIKAFHAPLLVGCQSNLIQEIRNKFLKANEVNIATDTLLEVCMAPSEYAKIKDVL